MVISGRNLSFTNGRVFQATLANISRPWADNPLVHGLFPVDIDQESHRKIGSPTSNRKQDNTCKTTGNQRFRTRDLSRKDNRSSRYCHLTIYEKIIEGTDVFTLKEILGHAEIKTTMIYVHANREAGRRAVEKLNAKTHLRHRLGTKNKTAGASLPSVLESNGGGGEDRTPDLGVVNPFPGL